MPLLRHLQEGWLEDQSADGYLPNSWGDPWASRGALLRPQARFILLQISPADSPVLLGKYCVKHPAVIKKNGAGSHVLKWKDLRDLSGGMHLCGLFSSTGG